MTEEADSNESRILEEPIVEAEATSCDDIPDFAVLCSFLDRFGNQLGIPCSIKEVQFMLEQQGNVSEQLIDIHVKLLRKVLSGANKVRFDKHLARFCESFLTPYNFSLVVCLQNEGYSKLDLASKVHILKGLLELQFDFNTKFKQAVNDKSPDELRLLPLGRDVEGMVYWLQVDEDLNVRLFSEDLDDEHSFKLLHKTKEELGEFIESLKKLKGEKFKGDNTPKRPMVHAGKTDPEDSKADVKAESASVDGEVKREALEACPTDTERKPLDIKVEVEEKKELVEDLCIRQNENSRSSGENQPAVKTKLENEAHCQPVKAEAPTDGKPEAAHSASSKEVVPEAIDTAATDLSLPHLPTPPHEQEQRLPAPPQSAVHSPPVPHKKSTDDDKTDHAAEDLRTGKKDHPDQASDGESDGAAEVKRDESQPTVTSRTRGRAAPEKGDARTVAEGEESSAAGERVESAKVREIAESRDEASKSEAQKENTAQVESSGGSRQGEQDEEKEEEEEEKEEEDEEEEQKEKEERKEKEEEEQNKDRKNKVEREEQQANSGEKMEVDETAEPKRTVEADVEAQPQPAAADEQQKAADVMPKKRGRGRPKKGQGKTAGSTEPKKPKTPRGRKAGNANAVAAAAAAADDDDDDNVNDEDYNGGKPARKSKPQSDEVQRQDNDQDDNDEDDEQPKKPKKLSREARMLMAEAERLRKAEEDADTEGRPRRSCRVRREVEKYAVSDDEATKKKRKSKADKEEDKEVVFVTSKNAKAARKAAKEMLKAQKLAHKELMRKLKGKKKRGRKGESDDDELDSMDGLLYGEEYEENEEEVLKFDDNDEDEFACDEEIADGEFTHEEVKKARTAKKADEAVAAVDDEPCRKCNKSDHPEFILLCDSCDAGYHMSCLKPALMVIPLGNWYCPPCEHDALIVALNCKLSFIEAEWEKRQKEITRKQRLAFVSINIGNVLPSSKRDLVKPTFADEEDFEDEDSEISEVGSSDDDDDDEFSDDSSGQPRRRRAARRGDAIREKMQEYDKIMREAIDDEDEVDQHRNSPARKRSGKDMSNILPESDDDGTTKKTKRRRKSKLSDLNAADSEEDSDDSEFQASDYSDIEINKRKPKKGRRSKFISDDDEEDSEANSDASWGRANIRSAKRAAYRRKNPLGREKSSKKGGSKWDDWDSEASQSFKASSDDSGDFCKPRKRQTVNYAESSEDEDEKPRASARRKKPSDDEVSIEEEEEDEEESEETPEEDVSNEEEQSASGDDDDAEDDEDEDDDDDDGSDSDAVARRKARKLAKKLKGSKKDKNASKKSKGAGSHHRGGDSKKKKPLAKANKRKKKNVSDDEEDSDEGSDTWAPRRKSKPHKAKQREDDEDDFDEAEDDGEETAKTNAAKRNGRPDANRARAKIIESDDNEEEDEEEEEDEDEDEDAPKAWPPLPSHLMANMSKQKKQQHPLASPEEEEEGVAATAAAVSTKLETGAGVEQEAVAESRVPSQRPVSSLTVAGPSQQARVGSGGGGGGGVSVAGASSAAVFAQAPTVAAATMIPTVVLPTVVPAAVVASVVPSVLAVAPPPLAVTSHSMAAAQNGVRSIYPTTTAGLVQYPSTAGQPSEDMTQYYQAQGYAYPAQYAYPPHHQAPSMPGYPAAAYSGAAYPHESFSEWGPSGPQAQVVAPAVEEKPSENFSISNILQQGDTNEELDSVTSIGNLMGK